tara:strand:- start:34 stop:480 length:447 start_codon:yes stop_codon:yes gene_type:complete
MSIEIHEHSSNDIIRRLNAKDGKKRDLMVDMVEVSNREQWQGKERLRRLGYFSLPGQHITLVADTTWEQRMRVMAMVCDRYGGFSVCLTVPTRTTPLHPSIVDTVPKDQRNITFDEYLKMAREIDAPVPVATVSNGKGGNDGEDANGG